MIKQKINNKNERQQQLLQRAVVDRLVAKFNI
jgi:hypothetical protein